MLFRVQKDKENPYVMLNKSFLSDVNLSAKAKGILAYLMCLPDDWKIYLDEVSKHFKDGVKSITSGVNELMENGYISRNTLRDSKGRFKGYMYDVFEVSSETPKTENGETENGKTEFRKRHTTNKLLKLNNNKLSNKSVSQEEKTDGQTDNIIQTIIKQSELYCYPDDKQKLVEESIRIVFTQNNIAYVLKMGLTQTQLKERLQELKINHIDRAFRKYNERKDNITNTLIYFTKVLIESIAVAGAEEPEYGMEGVEGY